MNITFEEYLVLKKTMQETQKVRILSNSMEPFIHTDEEIVIKKFESKLIRKFTPIVFWYNERLICHFYIKKINKDNCSYYLTKSLNSKYYDELIKEEHVLGEVIIPKVSIFKKLLMAIAHYKTFF